MIVAAVACSVHTRVIDIPLIAVVVADIEAAVHVEDLKPAGLCLTRNQCLRFCNVFFSESAHRDKSNNEERNDEERKNAPGNFLHTIYLR